MCAVVFSSGCCSESLWRRRLRESGQTPWSHSCIRRRAQHSWHTVFTAAIQVCVNSMDSVVLAQSATPRRPSWTCSLPCERQAFSGIVAHEHDRYTENELGRSFLGSLSFSPVPQKAHGCYPVVSGVASGLITGRQLRDVSLCLSVSLSLCLSVSLSLCLSVSLCLCVSVSLCLCVCVCVCFLGCVACALGLPRGSRRINWVCGCTHAQTH